MTEEERSVKRRKIEENRIKKSNVSNRPSLGQSQLLDQLIGSSVGGGSHNYQQHRHQHHELKCRSSEAESSFSDSDISNGLSPSVASDGCVESSPSQNQRTPLMQASVGVGKVVDVLNVDTMDSLLNTAIRAEYNVGTRILTGTGTNSDGATTGSVSPVRDRSLNPVERGKLDELIVANKALLAPLTQDGPVNLQPTDATGDPTLLNVINLTDIAIRRIIKMAKKLAAFKTLCQEDQIALLKGGCTELMILRSVMSYDADKGCWKIPHTDSYTNHIKVEVLKEARGNVYEEHQRFIQSFDPLWRSDEQIMLLLSAVTLFDASRPNVVHGDAIRLEQESYYYLLRRYLESTVGGCRARSMFLQLVHKVAQLHILNEKHVRVYLDVNPKEVEPLLIEIFDLKAR